MTNGDSPGWKESSEAAKRALILDAALRVFGTRGLDGPTMDDVAAEAGYARRSLYRHFPTKETLLEALAGRCFASLTEALGSVADTPLFGLAQRYARFGADRPREFRVILEARRRLGADWTRGEGCWARTLASRLGPGGGEILAAALGYLEFRFLNGEAWAAAGLTGSDGVRDRVLLWLLEKEI